MTRATLAALTLAGAMLCAPPARAQTDAGGGGAENNALDNELTAETIIAVDRGLEWLAARQQDDGSFLGGRFGKNVAIASVASLAFMADGHLPGRGAYGDNVERALDFVLSSAAENGLIAATEATHGPMYGHGFATLFLGEVEGMTRGGPASRRSERLHEALIKAVRLIERTQNDEGGWRYNPVPYDADVSVTICQVMALRSARTAGLEVDAGVIDRAVEYVKRCQNPDGGFRYQADTGSSAWPRSAAGVATLFYAGIYDDDSINRGMDYLERVALPGQRRASRAHYFYGQYYGVQAAYLAGGDRWALWWPAVRDELIAAQEDDGSWSDTTVGSEYGTAMALIVLQMPKRYLPIFQK